MTTARTMGWSADRFRWEKIVRKDSRLSRGARLLAAALVTDYVDRNTGACFPGRAALAADLGCSERSIDRYLRALEGGDGGPRYLEIDHAHGPGRKPVLRLRMPSAGAEIVRLADRKLSTTRDRTDARQTSEHATVLSETRDSFVGAYIDEPRNEPIARRLAHDGEAGITSASSRKERKATDPHTAPSRRHAPSGGYVLGSDEDWKRRRWEDWLASSGLPPLDLIARHTTTADGRKHWLVSAQFHPRGAADGAAAMAFFARHGQARAERGAA